jgi:GAF domain-containing protein
MAQLELRRAVAQRDRALERQRFLSDLSDRLRDLADPVAVAMAAAAAAGRRIGVARAGYGEIDECQQVVTVHRDWTDGRSFSLAGEARLLDAFGPAVIAELRAGRSLVVEDFRSDPRAGAAYAATWESIDARSLVVVPLVRAGRLRAIFYLHEPEPRVWRVDEIELAEATAERTWAAVEQARTRRRCARARPRRGGPPAYSRRLARRHPT